MSEKFIVPRDTMPYLEFDGQKLSFTSTWQEGKPRWTELALYRVYPRFQLNVRWLVHSVGKSDIEDEVDLNKVTLCESPEEVFKALSRNDRLTNPGFNLLDFGSEKDDELAAWFDAWVEENERTESL